MSRGFNRYFTPTRGASAEEMRAATAELAALADNLRDVARFLEQLRAA